jgi:hypothetical protein
VEVLRGTWTISPFLSRTSQDDGGLTLIEQKAQLPGGAAACVLTLRVADVAAKCWEMTHGGVVLEAQPQKLFRSYGAQRRDPDEFDTAVG